MRIEKARHAGACYGVKRALELAQEAAASADESGTKGCGAVAVQSLGPLIHNPGVVADLEARGVRVVEDASEVEPGVVIIRSHGVTPDVFESLEDQGAEVIDATCPHVARAQKAAAQLAQEGCHVIVVGESGHPEVEAIFAWAAREGAPVCVVSRVDDIPDDLRAPVGIVVQTTQKAELLEAVTCAIEKRGIDPVVKNTICSATALRQEEAADLARDVDVMVVIGGRNSSNTTRLAELCAAAGAQTFHVERASELQAAWFAGAESVGVTAGASTPRSQIDEVIAQLQRYDAS